MELRTATAQDRDFLLAVFTSVRTAELALAGLDERMLAALMRQQFEAQTRHYQQQHPDGLQQIVVDQGQDVGRVWTAWLDSGLHLLDISLLPAARGRGLGTRCLQQLQAQAHARGLPLSLHVELHNPARRLYERLGFVPSGAVQGLHLPMHRPPPARGA